MASSPCSLQLDPGLASASSTIQGALTLRFWGPTYFHRVHVQMDLESIAHV